MKNGFFVLAVGVTLAIAGFSGHARAGDISLFNSDDVMDAATDAGGLIVDQGQDYIGRTTDDVIGAFDISGGSKSRSNGRSEFGQSVENVRLGQGKQARSLIPKIGGSGGLLSGITDTINDASDFVSGADEGINNVKNTTNEVVSDVKNAPGTAQTAYEDVKTDATDTYNQTTDQVQSTYRNGSEVVANVVP